MERYWSPLAEADPASPKGPRWGDPQAPEEAVRYRLIADVPLGAFLSGGIDSRAVVAEMRSSRASGAHVLDRVRGTRVQRSARRGGRRARAGDRSHRADRAAGRRTAVRRGRARLRRAVRGLLGGPDAAGLAARRRHVKVALSGDGGDELFGGYTRYLDLARGAVPMPAPARHAMGAFARRLPHGARAQPAPRALPHPVGRYAGMVAYPLDRRGGRRRTPGRGRRGGLWKTLLDALGAGLRSRSTRPPDARGSPQLSSGGHPDEGRPDEHGGLVEARVPLLDHGSSNSHLASEPAEAEGGTGKWIFRRAIRGLVPSRLRSPKQGFGIPLRLWLRNEVRHRWTRCAHRHRSASSSWRPR